MAVDVVMEVGARRVFASAVDWPGWCRAARGQEEAIQALDAYGPRYAKVAARAGVPFKAKQWDFSVVERLKGDATTEFGAPGAAAKLESRPMTRTETERTCKLLEACWAEFDAVVEKAPAALRKGPRGGGRDRDKIVEHVLGAECGYAPQLGLKLVQPAIDDRGAIAAHRAALIKAIRAGADGKPMRERGRPARYMARRIAWHALDHAWEIEDRSES